MEINNIYVRYDINRKTPPCRIAVTHVNDVNTRIIELELTQNGEALELGAECTVSASVTARLTNQLIGNNIPCSVTENGTILIPADNLHFRGRKDINVEVSVFDSSNAGQLTLPYPLWIRVNPSVLDNAEITDESLGTIPELLDQARELVENYHYVPTQEELEQVSEMVDTSGKEDVSRKQSSISNQSMTSDSVCYPNINAVRNFVNYVRRDIENYVDEEIDAAIQTAVGGIENGSY